MGFKNIVLTTDFSENANAATPYAIELARKFDGSITLLSVFEDPSVVTGLSDGLIIGASEWVREAHNLHTKQLNELAESLSASEKIKVVATILRGNPVAKIIEFAEKHGTDCIVIATHGRTGLSHAVHGSVSERVVRMSPCPVLSVRPAIIVSGFKN